MLRAGLDTDLEVIVPPTAMRSKMVGFAEPSNIQGPRVVVVMPLDIGAPTHFAGLPNKGARTNCFGHLGMGRVPLRMGHAIAPLAINAPDASSPFRIPVPCLISTKSGGRSGTCMRAETPASSFHLVGPN